MGGGSPSPSPSPAGSPRGHNIEGDLTNALNNCRIRPADPGSSAAPAAAMPTCFGGHPPFSGCPSPHHKHKLKCHLKIKHRHHGPPKIMHKHHEHIKIKHRHHMHRHGGEKENHRFPHFHPMNIEAPLGCGFHHHHGPPHHHGGPPHPHPPGRHPHHHMRQRRHGHCCSYAYHHFFTAPMGGPGPVPVPVAPPHD